jgi:tetratricopeptide (TPR) repeat protein
MEPGEYEGMIGKAASGNSSAAIDLLQAMRTHKIRQPELVVLHGGRLLSGSQRKLGTEVWTVFEQVFLAAVEIGAEDWRDYCLKELTTKFPSSVRVERLKGIHQESLEKWSEAQKIYRKIIEDKPEDTVTLKRLIAMYKQRGRIGEAVEELNKYLATFSTDTEVWHELAELYIEAGSLQRAVFCFEELLVSNPRSMYHVLTHAELLYSTGDFELSRKYYSLASYLDGTCLRALWGLAAVNMMLADKDTSNEKMLQLQTFTIDRLKHTYKGVSGSHGKLAVGLLQSSFAPPSSST